MRSFCLSCAGLLFGLLSAAGCSKGVDADFPRPPATAATPPPEEPAPEPAPPAVVEVDREPEPAPEPTSEIDEPEPAPAEPRPAPEPAEPVEEAPPEPASTQLARPGGDVGNVDPEVLSKLEQAGSLLSSVGGRDLSQGQREQVAAARGFVAQARRALDEGDERRALVLVDKGLILAEDVERTSRP
jgi:hypothetical protein